MSRHQIVEPVSLYQDLSVNDNGEFVVNMLNGKFTDNKVPAGYRLACSKLLVTSYDVETVATYKTSGGGTQKGTVGYNLTDLRSEFIFKILVNGTTTEYNDGGGIRRHRIDEGYLLPYYEVRLLDTRQILTTDFKYIVPENGNLIVLIQRPTVPVALDYTIVVTSRLIGRLEKKLLGG